MDGTGPILAVNTKGVVQQFAGDLSSTITDNLSDIAASTLITEVRDWRGESLNGAFGATLAANGRDWTSQYPFSLAPYGVYNVEVSAEDNAGNGPQPRPAALMLDGFGPAADIVSPGLSLASRDVITGTMNDSVYSQPGRLLHLHFGSNNGSSDFFPARWMRWSFTIPLSPLSSSMTSPTR